jgi:hypothetical protein
VAEALCVAKTAQANHTRGHLSAPRGLGLVFATALLYNPLTALRSNTTLGGVAKA